MNCKGLKTFGIGIMYKLGVYTDFDPRPLNWNWVLDWVQVRQACMSFNKTIFRYGGPLNWD